jgi:hypothetical protein
MAELRGKPKPRIPLSSPLSVELELEMSPVTMTDGVQVEDQFDEIKTYQRPGLPQLSQPTPPSPLPQYPTPLNPEKNP